ncbi:putative Heterokaryon incompatibility protein [Seiridium cardinale]|uniref:Heterokaryon incompatibility protein n=1 Tax=Seiridium cardinale TaxID=138064 RepID=A0ABR2XHG8_9PEZI
MVQKATYAYHSIENNQFRLLRFVQDEKQASAVLETFSMEGPLPPYHALSYTWACEKMGFAKTYAVHIKDQVLPVLESLKLFVEAMNSKGDLLDGTWWWIDSICIDQDNLRERAQQVQLMQHIYRRAKPVVIWLGEESSDSNLAIDFIRFIDKISRKYSLEEVCAMVQKDHFSAQWVALTNFFSRKWWARIWTVQEFVLPPSISIWCGMRNVSRTAVCRSLRIADRCPSTGMKGTLAFNHGFNRRRAWALHKVVKNQGVQLHVSLLAYAAYFCCMDATDDRDRLYGLMALANDGSLFDVNYSLSTQEVYLRFTQAFIAHHKSLDIICFASVYDGPPGFLWPSWVPNWRKRETLVIPLMVSQSSNINIGNLRSAGALDCDEPLSYSASKNKEAAYEYQGATIIVRGVLVDSIDGLAGSANRELVQTSEWQTGAPAHCSGPQCSPTDIVTSVCNSLVLSRKDRYLQYAMPAVEFLRDFLRLCAPLITESRVSTPRELQDWFNRARSLQIGGNSFESILRSNQQAVNDLSGPVPNQNEMISDSFFGRFYDIIMRMSLRLMVSRNGRVGMVPEKANKGDLVCVLFGCSVPVLLRKSEHGDGFTLVGECFLDGCMNGSLLDQDGFAERTFCIR